MILAAACSGLTTGDDEAVALEFVNPPDSIGVGDTVALHIRAINRNGDSIPGAPIVIFSTAPDTLGIDSAALAVIGLQVGTGSVVARVDDLPTAPFRIRVR